MCGCVGMWVCGCAPKTGVPHFWDADKCPFRPVRKQAAPQEVSLNVVHLNHLNPCSPPPGSLEKLPSMKLVPGAKSVGDCSPKTHY